MLQQVWNDGVLRTVLTLYIQHDCENISEVEDFNRANFSIHIEGQTVQTVPPVIDV